MKSKIKAEDAVTVAANNSAIIGEFEGECADATITNENGLDITRDVFVNVFASDEYARGIKYGWFIGYLGHPEDPGCQEFKDGCIVMTDGWIADTGKVYGKFNLIDTPVGRVVKAFIDAGVQFGISIRGAGDIINNSVDPDTFVFRGFDLVAFPAYPDSIPAFTQIAASTDADSRAKYKKICASIKTELDNITSVSALDAIQAQFAAQSDEYAAIEARKQSLEDDGVSEDELEDINDSKVECVTKLYLESISACKQLKSDLHDAHLANAAIERRYQRKIESMHRIASAQMNDLDAENEDLSDKYSTAIQANKRLSRQLDAIKSENLKYKHKIASSKDIISEKDEVIASLQSKINETVVGIRRAKSDASNRDEDLQRLRSEVKAAKDALSKYQSAYAKLYATAIGVDFNNQPIKASTSVEDLQRLINSDLKTSITASIDTAPIPVELEDISMDDDGLITM